MCIRFWWGNLKERDHWGDQDVDGRIILRWIFEEVGRGYGDWMELAENRDRWRALVSTVMNFRVSLNARNSLSNGLLQLTNIKTSVTRRIVHLCATLCA